MLDVPVAYGQDSERARALVEQVAAELAADPEWSEHVLEAPEIWGVEDVQADAYLLRLVVKTEPLQQWPVARSSASASCARSPPRAWRFPSAKPE